MKRIKKVTRLRRRNQPESAVSNRITNETVAEHREEVLGKARKYIYPLQQSKHRLVTISISLLLAAIVIFFGYCVLALYKFKSNSGFLYKVTEVVPFPIARTGSNFVSYQDYYFEVNHYTHYYRTQQDLDFNGDAGKQQLAEFKKRALEKVINDAYIKELAKQKGISVSNQEVDQEIAVVRSQSRLGASDKEFQSVLKDFWNWDENDFRRSLKTQLLSEKVNSALDTGARDRANAAEAQLKSGKDFATLAREVSEDPVTKANGGEYGVPIDKTNRDIDPKVIDELFKLQDGQVSGVVDTGYGLEIIKRLRTQQDGKLQAAHIAFNFKDINEYLNDIKDQQKTRTYVRF